jgi:hypothetical protein
MGRYLLANDAFSRRVLDAIGVQRGKERDGDGMINFGKRIWSQPHSRPYPCLGLETSGTRSVTSQASKADAGVVAGFASCRLKRG